MSDLDTIFESHAETVWRIVYRLLADNDDARDCYQQTFLDAMQIDPRSVGNWQAILSQIATSPRNGRTTFSLQASCAIPSGLQ